MLFQPLESASDILPRLDDLGRIWPEVFTWNTDVREQIEIEAAYAGYLDRQRADAESLRKDEDLRLPADLDYAEIGSLSNEVREKLARVRPLTLGQAARIEGVTPGALTALLAHGNSGTAGEIGPSSRTRRFAKPRAGRPL